MTALPAPLRLTPGAIPFLEPDLPPLALLLDDYERICRSNTYSNGGPFERRFAQRLAAWIGVRHAIPVASATAGLMLAVRALARPVPNGKVLVPSFTFAATPLAAEWCGFEPLFCDVDPASWQMTATLEELRPWRDRLALILLCNTFGAPADVAAWSALARALDVPLLIDSAPGLGATYPDGRRQGAAGFTEVFSMHATKPFAVGEGGVVTTDDPVVAERVRRLRNFGFDDERLCADGGLNAKLSEMMAAIACRVLDGFDLAVARRRALAARYLARLRALGFAVQGGAEHSAHQFFPAVVPAGTDPGALRAALDRAGIQTRDYYARGLHQHPHFRGAAVTRPLAETERLAGRLVSFPMSTRRSLAEIDRVCDAAAAFLEGTR